MRFSASPALQAEDLDLVVEGRVIGTPGEDGAFKPARIAVNPITLSADGETLFFGAMNGKTWYRVPARLLRDAASDEAIAAAKGGVEGLVRSAAATYGAQGIRFNAVAPGLVRTPLTERITSNEKAAEASRSLHVLGRFGEPADVASAIIWLLDPAQSWVTGQVVGVDGGLGTARTMPRG